MSSQCRAAVWPMASIINIASTLEITIRGDSLIDSSLCHSNYQCRHLLEREK